MLAEEGIEPTSFHRAFTGWMEERGVMAYDLPVQALETYVSQFIQMVKMFDPEPDSSTWVWNR